MTWIRLRLHIPSCYQHEPVISRLISEYDLTVNITGATLGAISSEDGCFDLELRGTSRHISQGLAYLESLHLRIVGRPNVDRDSWDY